MKFRLMICALFVMILLTSCKSDTKLLETSHLLEEEVKQLTLDKEELLDEVDSLNTQKDEIAENYLTNQEALLEANTVIDRLQNDNDILKSEIETLNQSNQLSMSAQLLTTAISVVDALSDEDFTLLSTYVHPVQGLRFSPYLYVNIPGDLIFNPASVAAFATDTTVYNWGNYDGSGDPINLTCLDYYDAFVYDVDFANPQVIGNNTAMMTGNMIDNHLMVYPGTQFVEFHFPGFDPQYAGLDWRSLRLVFEYVGTNWYLVGIVHGAWTI